VLAGDIGGTNARLAVVRIERRTIAIETMHGYASRAFPDLAPIALDFLARVGGGLDRACFGVACPVVGGECETPNLPWTVNARRLAEDIGVPHTRVINDLDAIAFGIERLGTGDLVTLQGGLPVEHGVIGLIGAGTGLGQAFLAWDGTRYRTYASEGGHASFAARTALEWELHRDLEARYGHVSCERILSGPGLGNIYSFLANREGARERPVVRQEVERDGAAAISRHALAGTDPLCSAALDLFAGAYGAQAGNLALHVLATGGIYVVGGIAPAIVEKLRDGSFISAFRDKGRMEELLARIPVHVVMNPNVGLLGAAVAATDDIELPESPDVAESDGNVRMEAR
jgi:glucokinase